ncbi:MAG: RluA family pseudouridine synthase [Brevinematia bacterium]
MYQWHIRKSDIKLIDFISLKLSVSKNKAKEIIDSKLVFVNSQRVWMAKHLLQDGDIVEFYGEPDKKAPINVDIVYEDDYLIVVNKPPLIITNESENSLEHSLRKLKQNENIRAVHRLDKETSGLVIFAKSNEAFEELKNLWKKKDVKKTYLAICYGTSNFKEKWISDPIDGKTAKSHIKLISSKMGFSYFEVEIITGRKHQVRKHLASIRHPIVGDKTYGLNQLENNLLKSVKRQLLHSYRMEFVHPFSGKRISFFAPIPDDFKNFLKRI